MYKTANIEKTSDIAMLKRRVRKLYNIKGAPIVRWLVALIPLLDEGIENSFMRLSEDVYAYIYFFHFFLFFFLK